MSLLESKSIKTKSELVRAINPPSIEFVSENELVDDTDLRAITSRLRELLRRGNRIHVVLLKNKKRFGR